MNYAEVAVNFPGTPPTFSYAIPEGLAVDIGQAVWVPFGARIVQGIVLGLTDKPAVEETKEIAGIIADQPLLSSLQVKLAQWISEHYLCPLFKALALMLPPGFDRRSATYFKLSESKVDLSQLGQEERKALDILEGKKRISLKELEKELGRGKARKIAERLVCSGVIVKTTQLEKTRVRPKIVPYIKVIVPEEEIEKELACFRSNRAYKQAEILDFLSRQSRLVSVKELRKSLKCGFASIKALEKRHLISRENIRARRDPLSKLDLTISQPHALTVSQQAALESITRALREQSHPGEIFLLFGVTGSGKTEVYLHALAQAIARGKKGICLIPEIALTAQTVERFASRFPGRVAVLHSGLSLGERFDEWQWIREGNCDVVIGPRSALFAPLSDLGIIIIDEEHEWTYKQEDKSPRYHAREVAIKLAQLSKAIVILGSATPDVVSFYKAEKGEYHLLELRERITPRGYSPLPEVEIIDLREELKAGNTSLLSRPLLQAMKETLAKGEQTILFLNRRGTATFVRCSNCGFVFRCPRCAIALTYHSVEKRLVCHRCRYSIPVPGRCPECFRRHFKFLGIGTQRVEEEVRSFFPQAKVLRWDKDVVTRRYAHEEILKEFRHHRADVLVGTQMIAKGLDLPEVTLAGVINADIGLNLPDFRSGERTFQLLCQVAGRAGRGFKAGKVIIQTYSPENYAIVAAAKHDYLGFYQKEINYRRQFNYPPFSQMVRLVYSHTNEARCREEAERVHQLILSEAGNDGISESSIIGPVPAFAFRVRGRYRWQLFLRSSDPVRLLSRIALPRGWTVDVDPVEIA